MKRSSAGPILVLFARPPKPGEVKPRLAAALGDEKALALHRAFLLDSMELLHRVSPHGIRPAVAWSGAAAEASASFTDALRGVEILEQQGDDPGQRMSGVLADLLARGHDCVAIIGDDTPALPLGHLLAAFELLRDRDLVLGPSSDGGYYLLGARAVVPEIFRGISWGTDRVLAETLKLLKILGLPRVQLPVYRKVDGPEDLDELRSGLAELRDSDPTARNTRQILAI
jgi:rSAM/selenodomain-associated transferase 1